jgi:hypothetical protein
VIGFALDAQVDESLVVTSWSRPPCASAPCGIGGVGPPLAIGDHRQLNSGFAGCTPEPGAAPTVLPDEAVPAYTPLDRSRIRAQEIRPKTYRCTSEADSVVLLTLAKNDDAGATRRRVCTLACLANNDKDE